MLNKVEVKSHVLIWSWLDPRARDKTPQPKTLLSGAPTDRLLTEILATSDILIIDFRIANTFIVPMKRGRRGLTASCTLRKLAMFLGDEASERQRARLHDTVEHSSPLVIALAFPNTS